ncbi:MAG TPA: hypothetical protein VNR51_09545 [Hyphomicrobium sp.]|nr:hypothetical protein [Hyphomicrobium sp.]
MIALVRQVAEAAPPKLNVESDFARLLRGLEHCSPGKFAAFDSSDPDRLTSFDAAPLLASV